ncbi:DUF167 domain-containing protein [Dongia sp.]|uniref:DUF167 domain-containing protein n=1 Tax=Dongia sp. TaxID=1977262 RepID=UPI0035B01A46
MIPLCYELLADGIRLRLRVTPKSRRAGPQGFVDLPSEGNEAGGVALKLGINAAPEDGKANAAVIALLAKHLPVAKAAISVAAGAKDRRKLVDIRGNPTTLVQALDAWLTETLKGIPTD